MMWRDICKKKTETYNSHHKNWKICIHSHHMTSFGVNVWKEDPELRRVVLEGILEDLQSDDEMTVGAAQSSLDNYLHVYMREEGQSG